MKTVLVRGLKILISAAFLIAVYLWIEPADLAARIRKVALLPVACAFALNLAHHILNAAKIRMLLPHPRPPLSGLVGVNFITAFFGFFIPGSLASEVARWAYLSKAAGSRSHALAAVLLDRVTGLWAQILFSLAAWIWIGRGGMTLWFAIPIVAGILLVSLWAGAWGYRWFTRMVQIAGAWYARRSGNADAVPEGIGEALAELLAERGRFARVAAMSLLNLGFVVLIFLCIDRAVGGNLGAAQITLFLFLYTFIVLLPITVGNWGLSEGTLGVMYHYAGSQTETGVLISLLLRAVNLPIVAMGWYCFLTRKEGPETKAEVDA
jgi:glycosyltransferase 2 family protein